MLGGALGLATANHKHLLNPNSPIDLEAWRDALLQSTKNQVRKKHSIFIINSLQITEHVFVILISNNCFTIVRVAGSNKFLPSQINSLTFKRCLFTQSVN